MKSNFLLSLPSSLIVMMSSTLSAESLFLAAVLVAFCALNPLSQSAMWMGAVTARAANLIRFG